MIRTRQIRPASLLLLFIAVVFLSGCQRHFSPNLNIVSVHSLKGNIFSEISDDTSVRTRGMSLLSGALEDIRTSSSVPTVFIADNSNIHGTPAAYFSQGGSVIELLNLIETDVLVLDSREFYFGTSRLAELAELADFPLVSANVRLAGGQVPDYIQPYAYLEEYNLLVIGLSSPFLMDRNLPANVQGLELMPAGDAVRDAIARFQSDYPSLWQADGRPFVERPFVYVDAVSHKLSREGQNSVVHTLTGIEEIDLLSMGERDMTVDGLLMDTDQLSALLPVFHPRVNQSPVPMILVDDARSDYGGQIDVLKISNTRIDGYREVPLNSEVVKPDESISENLFTVRKQLETLLSTEIAWAERPLTHSFTGNSDLSGLITMAMMDVSQADVALVNAGSIRGELDEGLITIGDMYRILPFESGVALLELRGDDLRTLLEVSASRLGDAGSETGFLQSSGITYELLSSEGEYRLLDGSILVGGAPLQSERVYRIITTSYLITGGDGYHQFASFPVLQNYDQSLLNVCIEYLKARGVRIGNNTIRILSTPARL